MNKLILLLTVLTTINLTMAQDREGAQKVVTQLYEGINFDGKTTPDFEAALQLFTRDARMKWTMPDTILSFSPQEFFAVIESQIDQGILVKASEVEINNQSQLFGNIAHFFSSYVTTVSTPQGEQRKRGINSIQLVHNDNEWKIASIIWYDENEESPIPTILSEEKQRDRMAVRQAAFNYLESIYEVDTSKLGSVSKDLSKEGYYLSRKDSTWSLHPMTYEELKHTVETYNQKKWIPEAAPKSVEILDIDERVANVKVYAVWGFDYLLMTKSEDGDWVIQKILWQSYTFEELARIIRNSKR